MNEKDYIIGAIDGSKRWWQYIDPRGTGMGWFDFEGRRQMVAGGHFEEGATWREVSLDEIISFNHTYGHWAYVQS